MFIADLNPAQKAAVLNGARNLLIIAGPGTGKTHTLIRRIRQFSGQLTAGEKILAITFTNKAAAEMKERLLNLKVPESCFFAGTFHSFCLNILREYFAANLPADFCVPSAEEIEKFVGELWPKLKAKDRRNLLDEISYRKARDFSLSLVAEAGEYQNALREKSWLDFDDLLSETVKHLSADKNILARIRALYSHIFVDEYQDINPIQHKLLKLLAGENNRLTAIGDPNQSIYGFRGSDVKYFSSFAEDFPGAEVLSLTENYRSALNLLSASSQILGECSPFHVPELTAKIYREGRLIVQRSATDKAEAEYVVHQIEKMMGGTTMFSRDSGRVDNKDAGGRTFGDIAVLFRINSQRAILEQALDRSGIPYQVNRELKYDNPEEILLNAFKVKNENQKSDKVSLMTLHAAKGLEFPVVFIIGCEEHLLPLKFEGLTADIGEERRLFYVGFTRAKEVLYLTWAQRRRLFGLKVENGPSLFLADIAEELKEYEKAAEKPFRRKNNDQMMLFS